jgi:hypothetical protein
MAANRWNRWKNLVVIAISFAQAFWAGRIMMVLEYEFYTPQRIVSLSTGEYF